MKEKILELIMNQRFENLQEEGFEAFAATDGVEGLELFHDIQPDLVITDVKMPRKDGLGVLKGY